MFRNSHSDSIRHRLEDLIRRNQLLTEQLNRFSTQMLRLLTENRALREQTSYLSGRLLNLQQDYINLFQTQVAQQQELINREAEVQQLEVVILELEEAIEVLLEEAVSQRRREEARTTQNASTTTNTSTNTSTTTNSGSVIRETNTTANHGLFFRVPANVDRETNDPVNLTKTNPSNPSSS